MDNIGLTDDQATIASYIGGFLTVANLLFNFLSKGIENIAFGALAVSVLYFTVKNASKKAMEDFEDERPVREIMRAKRMNEKLGDILKK